jgi:HPt (histidine-containing phosphotransfer) domain-containing protein
MASPTPESVLDTSVIETLKMLGGDDEPQLFVELVDLFVEDAKLAEAILRDALAKNDTRLLERTAHTLKSSCANVGALPMSRLCFELEQLGRASKLAGAAELVERTAQQYELVQAALGAAKAG